MPTGQPDCSPPQTRALRRVETGPFRAQPSLARPLTAGEAGPGIILVGTIAVRPSRRPARPRQTQATVHKQDRLGLARVGPARVQSLGGQKTGPGRSEAGPGWSVGRRCRPVVAAATAAAAAAAGAVSAAKNQKRSKTTAHRGKSRAPGPALAAGLSPVGRRRHLAAGRRLGPRPPLQ